MATARFEARMPPEIHLLLKRAAALEGRSLSDFVISAALSVAKKTVEQNDILHLTVSDQMLFTNALIAPPTPNAAMQKALNLSSELLGE
ncbi:type II toxin-antitoxin system TacA family antitoxin [Rodentibacter haemolyticus]|uniref:DUF1778 domain-containing protein n=1 Tax=Rodentibacter haemolyticus TaxID=2778911 RepID=A0ABX6UXZ0_9PAST|nr:DUF1778 domain-containing protein [Rodentibacter haemolyticus]QPB42838.1 DUF1778 domain-containing protein [Rodentibacter haemolyticus]